MPPPLSLWQELILLALAGVAALYVFYFRIWLAIAVGSDLLFGVALAGAIASVVWPEGFDAAARWIVDRSPLPEALARADGKVAAIAALPSDLVDAALARLGYTPDPEPGPEPATRPDDTAAGEQADATSAADTSDTAPGLFVATVRPSIEGLVALVLRGATFVGSGFLLLVALASRASSSTARRLASLGARLDRLEAIVTADAASPDAIADPERDAIADGRANADPGTRRERT